MYNQKPAKLILENGRVFHGYALGKEGITIGELCFNTGVQMNPNRFGIGFVFNTKSISISYGYLTHPILPQTHQCNIGIEF